MGQAKRILEKIQEGGANPFSTAGRRVCAKCFKDEALRNVIIGNADSRKCDFCGKTYKKDLAADLETVADHIADCLKLEWDTLNLTQVHQFVDPGF